MKYVKFGIGVIIAQNINAGCGKCCGDKNGNNSNEKSKGNDNLTRKANEVDKKILNEISECFGVSTDNVIFKHKFKCLDLLGKADSGKRKILEDINEKIKESKDKIDEMKKKEGSFIDFTVLRFNPMEEKGIAILLVTDRLKYKVDKSKIVKIEEKVTDNAITKKENTIFYIVKGAEYRKV